LSNSFFDDETEVKVSETGISKGSERVIASERESVYELSVLSSVLAKRISSDHFRYRKRFDSYSCSC
jgi:hypothetical protein